MYTCSVYKGITIHYPYTHTDWEKLGEFSFPVVPSKDDILNLSYISICDYKVVGRRFEVSSEGSSVSLYVESC